MSLLLRRPGPLLVAFLLGFGIVFTLLGPWLLVLALVQLLRRAMRRRGRRFSGTARAVEVVVAPITLTECAFYTLTIELLGADRKRTPFVRQTSTSPFEVIGDHGETSIDPSGRTEPMTDADGTTLWIHPTKKLACLEGDDPAPMKQDLFDRLAKVVAAHHKRMPKEVLRVQELHIVEGAPVSAEGARGTLLSPLRVWGGLGEPPVDPADREAVFMLIAAPIVTALGVAALYLLVAASRS